MDTSRIMHALKGTRLEINLNSEGRPPWFQCVQLPGSDLVAGTLMMMTAFSQRRRNSHFSGEPAVAPSHPWGGNYGPWLQKIRPDFRSKPPLCWKSVDFSQVCEDAGPGFMNIGLSNKICFLLHLPSSSSSSSSFWDLILLQPSLTSDLRPLDLTHLLRWSSLRSIMAFFPLTSSS